MENIYADDWDRVQNQRGYEWSRMRIGNRLGGVGLGASVYLIGPGQKSFPYHFHRANEEMLIVLEGNVTVRTPEGLQEATKGDSLIFNRGPGGAHQVINNSESKARVVMLSTMVEPDIAQYPDTGKIGVFAARPPGGKETGEEGLAKFLDGSAEVGYFEGE